MKVQSLSLFPYQFSLKNGKTRSGVHVVLSTVCGKEGSGDIAPLPLFSEETLQEAFLQCASLEKKICKADWEKEDYWKTLAEWNLFPSVAFGLESALGALIDPVPFAPVQTSALLMGSPDEIFAQAIQRKEEGFLFAKVKVGNLRLDEAEKVILKLQPQFRLRIDVNRAWDTLDALSFFANFPKDAFDYVEEPFKNPQDLPLFSHPLGIDESFLKELSLHDLVQIPSFKALIYKPTIRGGSFLLRTIAPFAKKRPFKIILSSSFESKKGLLHIAHMALRCCLEDPIGIGTYTHTT